MMCIWDVEMHDNGCKTCNIVGGTAIMKI